MIPAKFRPKKSVRLNITKHITGVKYFPEKQDTPKLLFANSQYMK